MSPTADPTDVLLTFAEIAVAFAGFSSVVAIFERGAESGAGTSHGSFDLFRFSLAALFFSLLPFPLLFLGLSPPAVWSCSGGLLVLFIVAQGTLTARFIRRGEAIVVSSLTRGLSILANVVYTIIIAAQVLNVAGVLGRSLGPYVLGLFLVLFGAGVNFVRLVWVGNPPLSR